MNTHKKDNLAGASAGRSRGFARVLMNLSSTGVMVTTFLVSAVVVASYEMVQSLLFATVTIRQSQALAIGFVALGSTAAFYFAWRAQASARSELDAKRAEDLYQSRQVLQTVLNSIPQRVFWKDRDSSFLGCNQAFARDAALKDPADIVGKNDFDLPSKESAESYRADDRVVMNEDSSKLDFEERMERADGNLLWLRTNKMPLHDRDGRVIGVLGTYEDITGRKQAEEALKRSEEKYRSLVSNIPEVVWTADSNLNFAFISDSIETVSGFSTEEVYRQGARLFLECIHPDDIGRVRAAFEALFRTGAPYDVECRIRRKDGEWIWIHDRSLGTYEKDGVRYADGLLSDVTERKQAEEDLRVREDEFRSLVSNIPDVIWTVDSRFHIVFVSKNVEKVSGYTVQEIYGKGARLFLEVIHPDDLAKTREAVEALLTRGEPYDGELRLRRKDGAWIWVHGRAVAAYEKDGVRYVDGLFSDITERKRAEEARAFLATLVESSPDAIVGASLDGAIVSWNKGAELLYGYRADEVIGKHASILTPADRAAEVQRMLERVKAGQTTANLETSRVKKDGTVVEVSLTVSPIRNAAGEITGAATIARDITERKWNERELAYERRLFQALMDNIPDTIYFQDTACRFIRINKAQARMLGISDPNEAIGRTDFDFFPADFAQACYEAEQKLIQSGQPIVGAVQKLTRPDGQVQWLSTTEVPIRDAGDKVLGFVGISRDITERKLAEQQMRLLTTALESAANGVTITDRTGRILWVNPAFTRLTGYSTAEVVGQNPRVLKSGAQDAAFYQGLWRTVLAGAVWQGELVNRRKDGSLYTEEMTITPVRDAGRAVSHFIAVKSDVSERKLAEEKLRLAEEKHRSLVLNIPDVVWTQDSNGRFTFIRPKIEAVSGYSADEIKQQGARLFLDAIHPDDLRKVSEALRSLFEKGREYNVECRFRRKSGEWIWVRDRAVATYERDGVRFADGVLSDITEYKRMGIDLQQAQKLEAVGRLASGIAHEINTPIQFVGDNTRFLQDSFSGLEILIKKYRDLKDSAAAGAVTPTLVEEVTRAEKESDSEYLLEEIPKALAQTLDGVNRVATIVRAMKDFAHPDGTEKSAADLNKALLSTLTVARNELKYVADVETEFGDLPPVVCNIGDLNQVFLNLLVNAAHAVAEKVKDTGTKGRIQVRTFRDGGAVLITIADTGCGIPEANRARVFDPFFTTKEVGRGTGQGLAIARSVVVERHKGTLTFESEVGRGTTFYIRLPLVPVDGVKDRSAA